MGYFSDDHKTDSIFLISFSPGEFSIPYVAHDLCNKKEQLRIMREHVMLVVRAYNDIVRDINADEKRLFLDHIRKLDRRIGQGMTKLTWQNRGA